MLEREDRAFDADWMRATFERFGSVMASSSARIPSSTMGPPRRGMEAAAAEANRTTSSSATWSLLPNAALTLTWRLSATATGDVEGDISSSALSEGVADNFACSRMLSFQRLDGSGALSLC